MLIFCYFSSREVNHCAKIRKKESMTYCVKCLMPNDRELKLDSEFEAETDSEKWRHIKIKYHGIDSSVVMVPPEELGCMFNFEYIPRLMFLHEKDLRTISFNCSSPTESYCTLNVTGNGELNTDCCGPVRLDVCNGCFNSDISIRRIGVVGGIDVGCGVFADIDMNLGTFIGEYVGLVTSSSTSNNSIDDGSYSFLYPSLDGGFEINALQYGNAMRFVNHSVRPNAAFRRIFLGGILHIAVFLTSSVSADSQITVSYGQTYWTHKGVSPADI